MEAYRIDVHHHILPKEYVQALDSKIDMKRKLVDKGASAARSLARTYSNWRAGSVFSSRFTSKLLVRVFELHL
ncbi:hypothetical protein [Scytonema sp. PCC 10023]|uniref:hypothetical protein n=1 Tax=Scytonema sp. PCC 10023 TaxID=1680591 RepID=UPI0039C6C57E